MKIISKNPSLLRYTVISCVLLIIVISLILIACQKAPGALGNPNVQFKAPEAKEWYYGTFKKSSEYADYNETTSGKKLPDWKNGIYQKRGTLEIVEFPLVVQKFTVPISDRVTANEENKKRIANGSLSRIVFIKNSSGTIAVRELQYIPGIEYLANHNFDINNINLINFRNDFTGSMVVKRWKGDVVQSNNFNNGKVISKSRPRLENNNSRVACNGILVTEYARECEIHIYGDGMITQDCQPWMPTGMQWCYEEEEEEGGCSDPTSEECFCAIIGGCNPDPVENCDAAQQSIEGTTTEDIVSNTTTNQTTTTRTKEYVWTFYRQLNGLWKFNSHETGVHKKVNNEWQWESLTHNSISMEGTLIGGNVSCTLNTATVTLGVYWAIIALDYNITASIVCRGFPISNSTNHNTPHLFNVND
jgi:hypothetical protein